MEITKRKNQVKIVILILINIILISCKKDDNDLLEIIIDDFKTINSSKNISINIEQDSIKNRYYFIIQKYNNGFERAYYSCEYNDYNIDVLNNTKDFDIDVFKELDLKYRSPKISYEDKGIIDDSNQGESYIYETTDSIVEKRMSFDIYGNIIDEKTILKRWR